MSLFGSNLAAVVMNTIVLLFVLVRSAAPAHSVAAPEWSGQGSIRMVVEVPPVDLHGREHDEMVASYSVDFEKILQERGISGSVDLASLQVQRIDESGRPMKFTAGPLFENARTPFDRPCRFDEDAFPDEFPARTGRSSDTQNGLAEQIIRMRKGRLFTREVLPTKGKIVWVHTQDGERPSRYAIYFDVRPIAASEAWQVPPAPWIGDADVLRSAQGEALVGWSHPAVTTGDFNGDGLFDIIAGTEKGNLMWFPNHGEPGKPKFLGARILSDEHGPIDTGFYAAPFLFDWDNDGLVDLLAGTSHNVILWWKNVGTKSEPRLSYRGFVKVGDRRLEVPQGPVAEDYGGKTFVNDYYNQPWVGDFNGDGIPDIVTGGYTTGQIFLFRGTGRASDGTPILAPAERVEADGKPIDTTWAAAPFIADLDGDGRPDLITGSWWWSGIHHPPKAGEADLVMFYKNIGTVRAPRFTRVPLPRSGEFPEGTIARPSVVDWNNDGLPDLVVGFSGKLYVFLNEGSARQPKWRMNHQALTGPWAFDRDVDLVGPAASVTPGARPDLLVGSNFFSVTGSPYSPRITQVGMATSAGKPIQHPGPGYGDAYSFTYFHDWDRDGKPDLLWGTQQGNIYLHRGRGGKNPFDFEPGILLKLTTGEPIRVGPPVMASPEKVTDFTVLQGSRIQFVVTDFDGDGIEDLVVTDTYGNIWLYRNTKTGGTDTFAAPVLLAKLPSRTASMAVTDWNHDGLPDLIVGGTVSEPFRVMLNETREGKPELAKQAITVKLPYMFWGSRFRVTDWNQDGDEDLLVCSEFFTFFVERSFLTYGYRPATLVEFARNGSTD